MGFNAHLCSLIMNCISSASLAILWNGQKLSSFTPSRGLRQGDPLSPYLFVLTMEVLGHSIQRQVIDRSWRPIKLSKEGPPISHIFFADDLLLFGETSYSQARVIEHVLTEFCAFSGQRVNRNKSKVWFSPNTPSYLKHTIQSAFHIPVTKDFGMYLGVSLSASK